MNMMRTAGDDAADRLAHAAGHWDARLRSPGCTEEDRRDFIAWRDADPSHWAAFERLQSIVAGLRLERSRADLRAIRDSALGTVRKRRLQRNFGMAAAAAAVALVAAWTLSRGGHAAQVYSTSAGQRSTVELQDGSVLELNSATRVEVAFSEARRSLVLRAGQAIFKVAPQRERPFVVRAGDREIVALGTMFDVRLERSALRVTLIEGKVAVNRESAGAGRDGAEGARSDSVMLQPGQQAVVTQSSQNGGVIPASGDEHVHVRAIDVSKVTAWMGGRVFLEDMSLADAVAEMNRYSATQIRVTDTQLLQLRVNGMFMAGEQQAFAAALAEYFPIAMERRGEREIVLRPSR